FPVGDVDLAAAEIGRVDAAAGRGDHLLAAGVAAFHEGVGHPRHRQVGVGLPAAVAGGLLSHQPGAHPVVHQPDHDAVLDQHVATGGRALVVDAERAAPAGDRTVV